MDTMECSNQLPTLSICNPTQKSRCYEKSSQLQLCLPSGGLIGSQLHAGLFEHEPRRHAGIAVVVLVAVVHHLAMPDWMMALVHSLQGNSVTYTRAPFRLLWALLRMAFSSAWHTYIYLVSSGAPSRSQGISSSLQPMGIPL